MFELLLDLNFSLKRFLHFRCLQRVLINFFNRHCNICRFVYSQLYHSVRPFPEAFVIELKVWECHFRQEFFALNHVSCLELPKLYERRHLLNFANLIWVQLLNRPNWLLAATALMPVTQVPVLPQAQHAAIDELICFLNALDALRARDEVDSLILAM